MSKSRMRSRFAALLFGAMLAGCAQLAPPGGAARPLSAAQVESLFRQGLAQYDASRFERALADFNQALASGKLGTANTLNARKHMAFIYCVSHRQLQCREQFQTMLQLDPEFDLAPNEASHPLWGPVWASLKGAAEDLKAVSRGSGMLASAGQEKLAEGMREYAGGNYKAASEALRSAIASGLPDKADQIRAHKYAAFAYCLNKFKRQCQAEFNAIFALDPAFTLLPSEAGHPSWRQAYRKEQALVKAAGNARTR